MSSIKLQTVSIQSLQILKPLLQEMEQLGESLDQEEFVESCLNLMKTLTIDERAKLLSFKRKKCG